jgi:hypothetical protein
MFSILYYRPRPLAVLVIIDIGFILNKVYILSIILREQFPENSRRSAKAGNRGLFLAIKLSSLILTLELK